MNERQLTGQEIARGLGLKEKQSTPAEPVTDVQPETAEPAAGDVQPEPERDAEAGPVADTEQRREDEWLANHQRQLRRMQEANPESAAEIAVLFGAPEQRKREHDWLARLHQPRKDGAA